MSNLIFVKGLAKEILNFMFLKRLMRFKNNIYKGPVSRDFRPYIFKRPVSRDVKLYIYKGLLWRNVKVHILKVLSQKISHFKFVIILFQTNKIQTF